MESEGEKKDAIRCQMPSSLQRHEEPGFQFPPPEASYSDPEGHNWSSFVPQTISSLSGENVYAASENYSSHVPGYDLNRMTGSSEYSEFHGIPTSVQYLAREGRVPVLDYRVPSGFPSSSVSVSRNSNAQITKHVASADYGVGSPSNFMNVNSNEVGTALTRLDEEVKTNRSEQSDTHVIYSGFNDRTPGIRREFDTLQRAYGNQSRTNAPQPSSLNIVDEHFSSPECGDNSDFRLKSYCGNGWDEELFSSHLQHANADKSNFSSNMSGSSLAYQNNTGWFSSPGNNIEHYAAPTVSTSTLNRGPIPTLPRQEADMHRVFTMPSNQNSGFECQFDTRFFDNDVSNVGNAYPAWGTSLGNAYPAWDTCLGNAYPAQGSSLSCSRGRWPQDNEPETVSRLPFNSAMISNHQTTADELRRADYKPIMNSFGRITGCSDQSGLLTGSSDNYSSQAAERNPLHMNEWVQPAGQVSQRNMVRAHTSEGLGHALPRGQGVSIADNDADRRPLKRGLALPPLPLSPVQLRNVTPRASSRSPRNAMPTVPLESDTHRTRTLVNASTNTGSANIRASPSTSATKQAPPTGLVKTAAEPPNVSSVKSAAPFSSPRIRGGRNSSRTKPGRSYARVLATPAASARNKAPSIAIGQNPADSAKIPSSAGTGSGMTLEELSVARAALAKILEASQKGPSTSHIKREGPDIAQPSGYNCLLCKRDLSYAPEGPISEPTAPEAVAVLPCGHTFHEHCLQLITPEDQAMNPPCIPCAVGES